MDHTFGEIAAVFLLSSFIAGTSGAYVVTAPTRESFSDGEDGNCESTGFIRQTPTCSNGWVNQGTTDNGIQRLAEATDCSFFARTTTFVCYKNSNIEGRGEEICRRKRQFYFMKTECYHHWLHWETCDVACDGGVERRYKFVGTTSIIRTQERKCNTQLCPAWGPWSTEQDRCGRSCNKVWSRNCIYMENIVDPVKCQTDFSSIFGNLTHQSFPCDGEECAAGKITVPQRKEEPTPPPLDILYPEEAMTEIASSLDSTEPPNNKSTSNENIKKKDDINTDLNTQKTYKDPVDFTSTTFWIGFFIGIGILILLLIIFLIFFSLSKRGKLTFAALKRAEKKYQSQEIGRTISAPSLAAFSSTTKNPMSRSSSSANRNIDIKTRESSIYSNLSYRKSDCQSSARGSISGQSRSHDSWRGIKPIETYYTPVGQRKLFNREKTLQLDQLYADIPMSRHRTSSLTDFSSGSDSDGYLDRHHAGGRSPRIVRRNDGAFYYNKFASKTEHRDHRYFDDDAYIRRYKRHRDDKRGKKVQRSASSTDRRLQRSASSGHRRRRHSADKRGNQSPQLHRRYKRKPVDRQPTAEYPAQDDPPLYAKLVKRKGKEGLSNRSFKEKVRENDDLNQEDIINTGPPLPLPPPPDNILPEIPSSSLEISVEKEKICRSTSQEAVNTVAADDDKNDDFTFPNLPSFVQEKKESSETYTSNYQEMNGERKARRHPFDPPGDDTLERDRKYRLPY